MSYKEIMTGMKIMVFVVKIFNPLMTNVPHHIETSQLICIANQLTGFYRMGNIGCQWVKKMGKTGSFSHNFKR